MKSLYLQMGLKEIEERVDMLYKKMKNCTLCPRMCHADRLNGQVGFCKIGDLPLVASYSPHFGEESFLVGRNGSGTIFFSGCNLSCVYCQNWTISQTCDGQSMTVEQLANIMLKIQSFGCHNLNLVTPTHQIPMIIEALSIAIRNGLSIPIVYNSSGYESVETLQLLSGIVDIYMPDFKYADDDLALKYSGVSDYVEIATNALREMYKQAGGLKIENKIAVRGVFVRHLVLPNNIAQTQKIFSIISSISKEIPVNVMEQYHPAYKANEYFELSREISQIEYKKAVEEAKKNGLIIVS